MTGSTFRKALAGAAAAALALGAAATVHAQAYPPAPPPGGTYYDPCQRDTTQRETGGAVLGGVLGAVLGSHVAANHHRTDGSIVGGVLGAVTGAAVGKSSAACQSAPPPPPPRAYYAPPPPPPPAYYPGDYRDDEWAYGREGQRLRIAEAPGADGCTLAESPIYMPDGRVEKRFVRVCADSTGRYHVVD